jgi:transcriptional regulator with XRE-family HTH domain
MKQKNLCGPRVRAIRAEKRLRLIDLQAALALSGLDLDRTNLGRIENGLRRVSDVELVALAHVLDVSILCLLPDVPGE